MEKRSLITEQDGKAIAKEIIVFQDVAPMKVLSNPVAWKIIKLLSSQPMYPAQVSKELSVYEQSVYYYIRKLAAIGAVEESGQLAVRGGTAKLYRTASSAFGIELDGRGVRVEPPVSTRQRNAREFFERYFNKDNQFQGLIIVGAPEPHGPYKSSARDGHYAVQLAFFLGSMSGEAPSGFVVKLDSDAKAEKVLVGNNLISIGGPGTNLVTAEYNANLPIKFDENNFWAGLVDKSGRRYTADNHGLLAKIKNPNDSSSSVIIVAGVRSAGTKSAIIALTNFGEEVLQRFSDREEFAVVVQGFDMNSDGKIDHVDVVGAA